MSKIETYTLLSTLPATQAARQAAVLAEANGAPVRLILAGSDESRVIAPPATACRRLLQATFGPDLRGPGWQLIGAGPARYGWAVAEGLTARYLGPSSRDAVVALVR